MKPLSYTRGWVAVVRLAVSLGQSIVFAVWSIPSLEGLLYLAVAADITDWNEHQAYGEQSRLGCFSSLRYGRQSKALIDGA